MSEFIYLTICRSSSAVRIKQHCKAHCGVRNKTRIATMKRRNGLFARELPLAVSTRQIETRRFKLRNSTLRRVIVIRFHRTPTFETRSPSDIVAPGKLLLPDNVYVRQTFNQFLCLQYLHEKFYCIVIHKCNTCHILFYPCNIMFLYENYNNPKRFS